MAYYTEENGVLSVDGGMSGLFSGVQKLARNILGAEKRGARRGLRASTSVDRYKWKGGKSGDVDDHGIPYGTKMSDAIAMLSRAAVANPDVPPEQVKVPQPVDTSATDGGSAAAGSALPASAPGLPAGAPYGDEGATPGAAISAEATPAPSGTNWKLLLGLGAAAAALYYFSRRK